MTTCRIILAQWLAKHGYDGLYRSPVDNSETDDCSCFVGEELMRGEFCRGNCRPGVKQIRNIGERPIEVVGPKTSPTQMKMELE